MTIPTCGCAAIALSSVGMPSGDAGAAVMSRRSRRVPADGCSRQARRRRRAAGPRRRPPGARTSARSSPLTFTCPSLRPGRTSLPYRCTFARRVERGDVGERVGRGPRACCRARWPSPSTARGRAVSPSGRSSTARRCCSNWLVTAPSMVQWPELCGRIASSLTSTARRTAGGARRPRTARRRARR